MFFRKKRIYLDHASATPLLPEAAAAMRDAEKLIGNPGAIHKEAVEARAALTDARERIAKIIGIKARELIFTSGLTESNNLAIVGFARKLERIQRTLNGTHWIVSAIEHASVLECFAEVERLGGGLTHVMPNEKGIITADAVVAALKPETVFISVGWANNEIGTVQPLARIAEVLRSHEKKYPTTIIFHSDGGQAPLYEATVVHSLGVDLLSLSAAKLYGPHGVGCLYVSNRTALASTIFGGDQERGLRAGTESVALAAGFAVAFEVVAKERHAESKRLEEIRNKLADELTEKIPGLVINGDRSRALPHMLNISIPNIDPEYLTLSLDHEGFAVSTKSACNEGEKASHVVEALGGDAWRAEHTVRISLGRGTVQGEVIRFADALSRLALRAIVPIWTSRN
ncbi:MAG TPA: cysteine desulfurase family protein [Candidatus Paceibacterota bacterium]|jgi:cysteine desulfurase|nr:cysteine desulfurase family protein [Candidatus Paceibacterota bacterium]